VQIYKNICIETEIYQAVVDDLQRHMQRLRKKLLQGPREITGYDTAKIPGSSENKPADRLWEEYVDTDLKLKAAQNRLDELKRLKSEVDKKLEQLEGIDYEVVYLRDVENKRLVDIADNLGMSEIWIKKVSSRNPRIGGSNYEM